MWGQGRARAVQVWSSVSFFTDTRDGRITSPISGQIKRRIGTSATNLVLSLAPAAVIRVQRPEARLHYATSSRIFARFSFLFRRAGRGREDIRLPTGQRLHPAGRQVRLSGTLPLGLAVAPGGREVIVTCGGALQGLATVDARAGLEQDWLPMQVRVQTPGAETAYRPTGSAFYGLCLSPDGADALRGGRRHGPDQRLRAPGRRAADAARGR